MKGQVVAEVSVVPIGTSGTGLSQYVAACIDILDSRKDLSYQLAPMGTIIEGPIDKVFEVARQMHDIPFGKGVLRVVTTLKIDERRDELLTMTGKVESVLKKRKANKGKQL